MTKKQTLKNVIPRLDRGIQGVFNFNAKESGFFIGFDYIYYDIINKESLQTPSLGRERAMSWQMWDNGNKVTDVPDIREQLANKGGNRWR
jgi:hypothetical protein